jgi:hypothetical protein
MSASAAAFAESGHGDPISLHPLWHHRRGCAARKELYERVHPETKHGAVGRGRKKSRQVGDSIQVRFTKDAARKTGRSERSVQREVERANKIFRLADVVGTSLDAPDELDALAKLPERAQADLITRARAGRKVTARHEAKLLRRKERERELADAWDAKSTVYRAAGLRDATGGCRRTCSLRSLVWSSTQTFGRTLMRFELRLFRRPMRSALSVSRSLPRAESLSRQSATTSYSSLSAARDSAVISS